MERFIGIDLGAETLKVAVLERDGGRVRWTARHLAEHRKDPGPHLLEVLRGLDWDGASGAAVTGRFGRSLCLPRVPLKEAQTRGHVFLHGAGPATLVSIGSHGFSVLELRASGAAVLRENSRCSQGTGNFLRQLVERFDMTIEDAAALADDVADPAPLSGRCPVILKTDMTHLANKGESRARILAGLFDAVAENVQVLVKPRVSPARVALIGGVSRSARIREHFRRFLERHGMELCDAAGDGLFTEALGAALCAMDAPAAVPAPSALLAPRERHALQEIPALGSYLAQVRRLPAVADAPGAAEVVLGFDIGSTGSKAVAVDPATGRVAWQGYRNTNGDPVGAAQALMRQFLEGPAAGARVVALGATGSGREIVGSLMATCYGGERVFVLNEIAAHAAGALHHDPRVDTIFEIGGQDAKYIRLAEGRVVDAAMNEACSAGTGSFIEEQGRRFAGIRDVVHLGETAAAAPCGVSLGQHCSVFMAEIIDEAAAAGAPPDAIMAGIYDSVVQNYLNRVKGPRSVGQVVFCQGMPFASPALAAAVARQTGCEVVVPPHPGTVGALGIALLARHERLGQHPAGAAPRALDPQLFLGAQVEQKDAFVCASTKGCGGSGNKCRIERLRTVVEGARGQFVWGGACSLYDRGAGARKLPDGAPDPFRERDELAAGVIAAWTAPRGRRRIALTDEFLLKGLFPFFTSFLHELGWDPVVTSGGDHRALKRGIEKANVPFCAPMQLYHGLVQQMAEDAPDALFVPLIRELPRRNGEAHSCTCPIVQGSADVLAHDLGAKAPRIVSPVIDMGGDIDAPAFRASCMRLAASLGARRRARDAFARASAVQRDYDDRVLALGRRALDFCRARGVLPVVVLGRGYTIYNKVLNSNVPAILREQGAVPIPGECLPVSADVPVLPDLYWGHGQQNLRAAEVVRRTPGLYGVFCSNYSCGPDSFNAHFFSHTMQGKPFAIIETDGHSGDAGTKTRLEAFLYCVREDLASTPAPPPESLATLAGPRLTRADVGARGATLLVPRLSESAAAAAACLRGSGLTVETLPVPDHEALALGRRHTSGKECVPLTLTLGSLLQRVARGGAEERFVLLMPTADGPCRFGVYQLLQKIVLERLGLGARVEIWSPRDDDYFAGCGGGFAALAFAGIMSHDLLTQMRYATHGIERVPGTAQRLYERWTAALHRLLEERAAVGVSAGAAIAESARGTVFGCAELLRGATAEFAAAQAPRPRPTVLVVGEIYVRCDPFSNDFVIDRLQERGLAVRFAPVSEWLEYVTDLNAESAGWRSLGPHVSRQVQGRIQSVCYGIAARGLGWPARTTARQAIEAARPLLRPDLQGEACLTLGGAIHEWEAGQVDGVVSVGPLECMPNKLAESQFFHAAERTGLLSLTLSLNGDPVDPDVIDRFAYEVQAQFRRRAASGASPHHLPLPAARGRGTAVRRTLPETT